MSTTVLVVAGAVLLVGAIVQGTVGYGMNLIAGPILIMLDPLLVPVPVLLVATVVTVTGAFRELAHVDWRGIGWAMLGRLPGNLLGVLAIATLPVFGFTLLVAFSVLACVALSVITWTPRPTPASLVVAGAASGAFGTSASLGGPPVALLYQNEHGPTVRATLSAYFFIASLSSLATLAVAGQITGEHLRVALVLLPGTVVGFLLSGPLRRHVDGPRLKPAVLAVAVVGSIALIVRSFLQGVS